MLKVSLSFQNLRANPKYLKQIFGEELIQRFEGKSNENNLNRDQLAEQNNLIQKIFSEILLKFDELKKQIEEKENLVKDLHTQIVGLNSKLNEQVEYTNGHFAVCKRDDFGRVQRGFNDISALLNEFKQNLRQTTSTERRSLSKFLDDQVFQVVNDTNAMFKKVFKIVQLPEDKVNQDEVENLRNQVIHRIKSLKTLLFP